MSSGLNGLLLGILYVLGIIIYEYVKNGNFSPFEEGSFVVPFTFILGLIAITLGIILFLIGVILKYCSKNDKYISISRTFTDLTAHAEAESRLRPRGFP